MRIPRLAGPGLSQRSSYGIFIAGVVTEPNFGSHHSSIVVFTERLQNGLRKDVSHSWRLYREPREIRYNRLAQHTLLKPPYYEQQRWHDPSGGRGHCELMTRYNEQAAYA